MSSWAKWTTDFHPKPSSDTLPFSLWLLFLRSSHTRSSSTFKDTDMKYRILIISVGRSTSRTYPLQKVCYKSFSILVFSLIVTMCNDVVKLNFLHLSNSDRCLRREGLMQPKQHVTSFSCFLVLEANVVGHSSTDLVHRNIADDHNLSRYVSLHMNHS